MLFQITQKTLHHLCVCIDNLRGLEFVGTIVLRLYLLHICLLEQMALAYDIAHTRLKIQRTERLGYVIVDTGIKPVQTVFKRCLGGKNDDRYMTDIVVALDVPHHFQAVHLRHHNICDYKVGHLALQYAHKKATQIIIVLYDEKFLARRTMFHLTYGFIGYIGFGSPHGIIGNLRNT